MTIRKRLLSIVALGALLSIASATGDSSPPKEDAKAELGIHQAYVQGDVRTFKKLLAAGRIQGEVKKPKLKKPKHSPVQAPIEYWKPINPDCTNCGGLGGFPEEPTEYGME